MFRPASACGLVLAAIAVSLQIGCAPGAPPAPTATASGGVNVENVDRIAFNEVLKRLEGKIVLVDCWATWCLPCIELLPHTMELARKHAYEGLAVVTLSFDDSEAEKVVIGELEKAGAASAGTVNLQAIRGASTVSLDEFMIASGALPHFKLYDRKGELRRVFGVDPAAARQFTPADIDAAVAELLAE